MTEAPYDIIMSGPITGVPDYKERFAIAHVLARQEFRTAKGREANVFNPAMMEDGRAYLWYMRQCVNAILDSPSATLVQLDGWQDSKGARAEYALCVSIGMVIRDTSKSSALTGAREIDKSTT